LLNAGFIFGWGGVPVLGGAGCGWASGIGMWISFVLMAAHVAWAAPYRAYRLFRGWTGPRRTSLLRLLRIGLPMGGSALAEVAAFTGVALLIGSMGPTVIAAHQSALNFTAIMYMLPAGLSAALSIRVGQALGAGRAREARFIAWSGMLLALMLGLVMTPLIVLGREGIAAVYSPDAAVQHVVANLMLFTAAWYVADSTQVCAAGALRGYRVTLVPMLVVAGAYWLISIPLGTRLARHDWAASGRGPLGVYGYWVGLLVGVLAVALALVVALRQVARRHAEQVPSAA
ncbi:MATE family efflux transporter, partial [Aquabacterium sp.]|uniref:MATE family efflux transporter n=1 Tax=Aquabacterium sp. TaxID=1872578 RepID=UPI0035AFBD00